MHVHNPISKRPAEPALWITAPGAAPALGQTPRRLVRSIRCVSYRGKCSPAKVAGYPSPRYYLFFRVDRGRCGNTFSNFDISITNGEYWKAVQHNIPIFSLVEQMVYSEY
jgi:hypothetical protein